MPQNPIPIIKAPTLGPLGCLSEGGSLVLRGLGSVWVMSREGLGLRRRGLFQSSGSGSHLTAILDRGIGAFIVGIGLWGTVD